VKAHFYLPSAQYPTPDAITRFSDAYADRLRSVPGVSDVSITMIYPPYERWEMMFSIEGRPVTRLQDVPSTYFGVTDSNYLRTAGIPILRGRDFAETDGENAPAVAIVNQVFASRFFAHQDAIGRHIELGVPPNVQAKDPWMVNGNVRVTVVGVMRDSKNRGLELPAEPQLIGLFRQLPSVNLGWREVLVRSAIAPSVLERTLEQQLHALDPKLPLSEVEPMNIYMEELTADRRFTASILTAFAVLGLLLALIGVYGVVSYVVMQRNQELAIRLALGADRSAILWLIVREGMVLAAAGIAIGIACNVAASRALASMLYRISPLDALTVSATSALLLCAVVLASAIPARRATRIDPVRALRTE
jgi:predicted permease